MLRKRKQHLKKKKFSKYTIKVGTVALGLVFLAVTSFSLRMFVAAQTESAQNPEGSVVAQKELLPPAVIDPEIISHGDRTQHIVALTFDADMTEGMRAMLRDHEVSSWYNSAVTDTLIKNNAKATIFLTGLWTETYPDAARALASNPLFEIGNHSYSHPAFTPNCYGLPSVPNSEDENQITITQAIIKQTVGFYPKYFRFPGGCYDKDDISVVNSLGMKIVHWDVISGDSYFRTKQQIIAQTESQVQNGSIIVMHISGGPFAPNTNDALEEIIPYLKQQGYALVTLSELLSYN